MEGIVSLLIIIGICYLIYKHQVARDTRKESEVKIRNEGSKNIICPHCQTKGSVTTQRIKKKVGVSGGKATGAVLTCGLSLFATGLSRKDTLTEASCSNCNSTWVY